MKPPIQTLPSAGKVIDNMEGLREDDRPEVLSSAASTTSSFLQAAAIPPRLTSQETTPGAICVPALCGSFDDQHDNLLDMEDEFDENNCPFNDNTNCYIDTISGPLVSRGSLSYTVQLPEPAFSSHSQSTLTSMPIVAELAPNYEQEVEDRLVERLEAQIAERLQQEVDRRLSQEQRQLAIAEVINTDNDIQYTKTKDVIRENDNFKICGIRRTWWGLILCVIMLLAIAGVGSAYLWFSHAKGKQISTTDNSNSTASNNATSLSSAPTTFPTKAPTLLPSTVPTSTSPTMSKSLGTAESPQILVNPTIIPSQSPTHLNSNASSMFPSLSSLIDRRREHLITTIAPYVVPEDYEFLPEAYFVDDTYKPQNDALTWMANVDMESDVFAMPAQLLIERYVLTVLYYSTGGDEVWTDSLSFLSSSNTCNWNNEDSVQTAIESGSIPNIGEAESMDDIYSKKGAFCQNGPFVTLIIIPKNMLKGEVPWELSLLEYLTQIDFDTNELYGSIPTELSRLRGLKALWLKSNEITGSLPKEFSNATELASIDLEDNKLTSTLPSEWGSLSNLFYISLRLNNLTGNLPSDWQTLNKLNTLDLSDNQLNGTLPVEFDEWTSLESLYLESNRFEGHLPPSLGRLVNLVNLFVDDNFFSGTVPTEYSALIKLEYFWFNGNLLRGSVDDIFCDQDQRVNAKNLKSDCLANTLDKVPEIQIECSCCISCCGSDGNCVYNPFS